jgi:hypothetical protein
MPELTPDLPARNSDRLVHDCFRYYFVAHQGVLERQIGRRADEWQGQASLQRIADQWYALLTPEK